MDRLNDAKLDGQMVLLPNGIVQLEIQDKFSLTGRETDATSADSSYIQVLDNSFGGNLVLKTWFCAISSAWRSLWDARNQWS